MLQLIFISSVIIGIIYFLIPKSLIFKLYGKDQETLNNITNSILILFFYVLTLFNTEMLRVLGKINVSELYRNIFKFFRLYSEAFICFFQRKSNESGKIYIYGFVILSLITTILVLFSLKKTKNKQK